MSPLPTSASLSIAPPPVEDIHHSLFRAHDVRVSVLRLDRIHPQVHGNKWFKLRLNLDAAREQGFTGVLSFGGAYSNHLVALAAAGQLLGLDTVGIVRGELITPLNPWLARAESCGMQLQAMSRADYREKDSPASLAALRQSFPNYYLIPEGGSNALGVTGCEAIADYCQPWLSHCRTIEPIIAVAAGTGSTLAGLIRGLGRLPSDSQPCPQVVGVAVLKAGDWLRQQVQQWLAGSDVEFPDWRVLDAYHCGGYARRSPALDATVEDFATQAALPTEPVYTGKLLLALCEEIRAGGIARGSEVLLIHTGGLPQYGGK